MDTVTLAISALIANPELAGLILNDPATLASILTDPGFADGFFGAATGDTAAAN